MSNVRRRGKGKKPAMAHITIRVPIEVAEYFRSLPKYTETIREVLTKELESMRAREEDAHSKEESTNEEPNTETDWGEQGS